MKSRIIFFIVLIVMLLIGGCSFNTRLPKELNANDVKEISINNYESNESILILTADENEDQISEAIDRFNKYKMHEDQESGTTHPIGGKISFNDGSALSFSVGVGDFVTVRYEEKQYNIVNQDFNDYIEQLLNIEK